MKHNINRLIILFAIMFAATGANAQKVDKYHAQDGCFNHLSVGLNAGLTGFGIDAAMPVCKIVTLRGGFSGWGVGRYKFKAINTAADMNPSQTVEDDAVKQAQRVDKVELAIEPNFWNFYVLAEVHPFKNVPFYFAAGLFMGSKNFLHFSNTNEGGLGFLYDANQKVMDYNRIFHTNYDPIGLKFGDYVFTADENGNIDVRMKTNAVKPYIGIGFGQHLAQKHRVSLAVDFGLMFWGTPKLVLNNGTEVNTSGKNSGIGSAISWLKAWPNLQIRVAYKIF